MTGLKRGTVKLVSHQKEWREDAENIISLLKQLLGNTPIDIQHIGSTAIFSIRAKPIIGYLYLFKDKLRYGWQKKEYRSIYSYEQYWRRTC